MFPSTRYTLLRQALTDDPARRVALNAVAELYWEPCVRYIMVRWRTAREAAEDLVQSFFTALVEQQLLAQYDPTRGMFRPWLRACLDNFVRKQVEYATALRRGGGSLLVPLDASDPRASTDLTPEQMFHREWQRQVFALAAADLKKLCDKTGRTQRFSIFSDYDLAQDARPGYGELAAKYCLPVTTITNHLAWARRELRRLVEQRLGVVTRDARERQQELRSLLSGTGTK